MDLLPLNSPSLNTLLRSVGLKSDFQVQKNFNEQNFSKSFTEKLSKITTEKYEPGSTNYQQPESSYISLIQPQYQSNTPISKKNNVKNPYFENSKPLNQNSTLAGTKFNMHDVKSAQISSASSESVATGYFVTASSGDPSVLDLIPERKPMKSKFKIYFDQTKLKGTLVNVAL